MSKKTALDKLVQIEIEKQELLEEAKSELVERYKTLQIEISNIANQYRQMTGERIANKMNGNSVFVNKRKSKKPILADRIRDAFLDSDKTSLFVSDLIPIIKSYTKSDNVRLMVQQTLSKYNTLFQRVGRGEWILKNRSALMKQLSGGISGEELGTDKISESESE